MHILRLLSHICKHFPKSDPTYKFKTHKRWRLNTHTHTHTHTLSLSHIYTHTCKDKVSYLWSNFIHNTIIHKSEKSPPSPHQKQINFSQKCSFTHLHSYPEGSFQLPAANDTGANARGLPRVDGWVTLGFVVSHLEMISEKFNMWKNRSVKSSWSWTVCRRLYRRSAPSVDTNTL